MSGQGLGYESYAAPVEEVMQENTAAVKVSLVRTPLHRIVPTPATE
jgi:hypothetical protein